MSLSDQTFFITACLVALVSAQDNATTCQDTPGWTNGNSNTIYGCDDYANQWCADGSPIPGKEWVMGGSYNFPRQNCCVCGKGTVANASMEVPMHMYDLATDPNEMTDIIDDRQALADTLYQKMLSYTGKERTPVSADAATDEVLEMLATKVGALMPYKEWQAAGWAEEYTKPPKHQWPSRGAVAKPNQPNIVFVHVDDWGWNDPGWKSTYASFATPTLDSWKAKGVNLDKYYATWSCSPSRASLMTGRYPLRTGHYQVPPHKMLPLSESTLFEELKSVGYRTASVGKWHFGWENWTYSPSWRGVDDFFGYYEGFTNFNSYASEWTGYNTSLPDLHEGDSPADERFGGEHIQSLLMKKAKKFIKEHAARRGDQPLFLHFASMAMHDDQHGFAAPQEYLDRCQANWTAPDASSTDLAFAQAYCALSTMLDENLAEIECALKEAGMADNTIFIVAGDNGGLDKCPEDPCPTELAVGVAGVTFPLWGQKSDYAEGGVHCSAVVYGSMIPPSARGTSYDGLVHVSDWLPTIMGLAAENWVGPLSNLEIDGLDFWSALVHGEEPPRSEILLNWDPTLNEGAIIQKDMKLIVSESPAEYPQPFDRQMPLVTFVLNGTFPWTQNCADHETATEGPTAAPTAAPTATEVQMDDARCIARFSWIGWSLLTQIFFAHSCM